nr:uncharacterized protein LOC110559179 [Meriones unguiculatus]
MAPPARGRAAAGPGPPPPREPPAAPPSRQELGVAPQQHSGRQAGLLRSCGSQRALGVSVLLRHGPGAADWAFAATTPQGRERPLPGGRGGAGYQSAESVLVFGPAGAGSVDRLASARRRREGRARLAASLWSAQTGLVSRPGERRRARPALLGAALPLPSCGQIPAQCAAPREPAASALVSPDAARGLPDPGEPARRSRARQAPRSLRVRVGGRLPGPRPHPRPRRRCTHRGRRAASTPGHLPAPPGSRAQLRGEFPQNRLSAQPGAWAQGLGAAGTPAIPGRSSCTAPSPPPCPPPAPLPGGPGGGRDAAEGAPAGEPAPAGGRRRRSHPRAGRACPPRPPAPPALRSAPPAAPAVPAAASAERAAAHLAPAPRTAPLPGLRSRRGPEGAGPARLPRRRPPRTHLPRPLSSPTRTSAARRGAGPQERVLPGSKE